jgi:hypothetical protein
MGHEQKDACRGPFCEPIDSHRTTDGLNCEAAKAGDVGPRHRQREYVGGLTIALIPL